MKNGASKTLDFAMAAHKAEQEVLRNDLAAARYQIASMEKQLAEAREAGARSAELTDQLREIQAHLTTRQAELEASRAESQNLKEEVARASKPPPVRLGCPRCGHSMADYQHDNVRAKRCEGCQGVFFESGELDTWMKHHDEQLHAGKKSWVSSFFGRK
ncbi:MAG: zf-TFIIB domain-containing protein [Myxococcales bacterium]